MSGTSVIATIPLSGGGGPIVYDPSNGYVYVINGNCNVTIISDTSAITTIPTNIPFNYCIPTDAVYDPASNYVYFSTDITTGASNMITVISGNSEIASFSTGEYPVALAYDPSDGYVYALSQLSGSTNPAGFSGPQSILSLISGTSVVGTLSSIGETFTGGATYELAYDPADSYMYLGDVVNGIPSVQAISGGSIIDTFNALPNNIPGQTGVIPYSLAYDPGNENMYINGWWADSNTINPSNVISYFSGTSGTATAFSVNSMTFGTEVQGAYMTYDPGNGYMYADEGYPSGFNTPNAYRVISGSSVVGPLYTATGAIDIPPYGDMVYDQSNGYIYSTNFFENEVDIISGTSVVATVPI